MSNLARQTVLTNDKQVARPKSPPASISWLGVAVTSLRRGMTKSSLRKISEMIKRRPAGYRTEMNLKKSSTERM
jgi:hypothetical protein